jgi:hypothetical protein
LGVWREREGGKGFGKKEGREEFGRGGLSRVHFSS